MTKTAILFAVLLASPAASDLDAAAKSPKLRVFDVQRVRSLSRWTAPDTDTVLLVVTVHGISNDDRDTLLPTEWSLTANGQSYRFVTSWFTTGNNTPVSDVAVSQPFPDAYVVFAVPTAVTEFQLQFRGGPPVKVQAKVRIQSVGQFHVDS